MSTNPIPNINLSEIGLNAPVDVNKKEDSQQTDFLQLFVAQLKNQNPLEPQDGSEFLAQLAQFSTVEGIKNMESSLNNMVNALSSSQTLQATSLVGKQVEVKTGLTNMVQGQAVKGSIELPGDTSQVVLEVRNSLGEVVRTFDFSQQSKGDVAFTWDGLDENGQALEAGTYQFVARGIADGQESQLDTYIASSVDSVSINKNGEPIIINVHGFGQVSLDDVKSIS